jgi:hypothetical protein
MVEALRSRDILADRLRRCFESSDVLALYGDAMIPQVYVGFPENEPPAYIAVDEIADNIGTSGGASMGHQQINWSINLFLFAQHASRDKANATLMSYVDVVINTIMADPMLADTVDNSTVSMGAASTSADSSKYYIAAAQLIVNCTRYSACPNEIARLINDCNN